MFGWCINMSRLVLKTVRIDRNTFLFLAIDDYTFMQVPLRNEACPRVRARKSSRFSLQTCETRASRSCFHADLKELARGRRISLRRIRISRNAWIHTVSRGREKLESGSFFIAPFCETLRSTVPLDVSLHMRERDFVLQIRIYIMLESTVVISRDVPLTTIMIWVLWHTMYHICFIMSHDVSYLFHSVSRSIILVS